MHLEACACVLWCLRKVQTSTEVKVSATMISAIFLLMLLQINPNLTSVSHQRGSFVATPNASAVQSDLEAQAAMSAQTQGF